MTFMNEFSNSLIFLSLLHILTYSFYELCNFHTSHCYQSFYLNLLRKGPCTYTRTGMKKVPMSLNSLFFYISKHNTLILLYLSNK